MWLFCCSHLVRVALPLHQQNHAAIRCSASMKIKTCSYIWRCAFLILAGLEVKNKNILTCNIQMLVFLSLLEKTLIKDDEGQWKATLTHIITFTRHYKTQEKHEEHTAAATRIKRWATSGFVMAAAKV